MDKVINIVMAIVAIPVFLLFVFVVEYATKPMTMQDLRDRAKRRKDG